MYISGFLNVFFITIVVYRLEDNPNEVIRCLATSSKDSTIQSVEVNTALSQRQYDPVYKQSHHITNTEEFVTFNDFCGQAMAQSLSDNKFV